MKFDEYDLKAKIAPAFISILPILLFFHFYLTSKLSGFILYVLGLEILGLITGSVALTYIFVEICRFISKQIESFYFKNGLYFPTTNYLMYSNDKFSKNYKDKVRGKIKKDFNYDLMVEMEEATNNLETRKRINEAVGLIRKQVKDGHITLKRNIQYGLGRNLIGGSPIALVTSLIELIFFYKSSNFLAVKLSLLFSTLYFLLIIFSKKILIKLGKDYAEVLFEEYLSK